MLEDAGAFEPVEALGLPAEVVDPPGDDSYPRSAERSAGRTGFVDAVVSAHRDVCQAQARFLRALQRLAGSDVYPPCTSRSKRSTQHGFCGVEVASALTWSQYAAERALELAAVAVGTCPVLLDELGSGHLDWAKLKMLVQELDGVDPSYTQVLIDALRPEFDHCTVGQLRERLRRLILQVDPLAAKHRNAAAVARRKVRHVEFSTGTASLGAAYIPTEKAAAAWNNVDALARAAHAAGDPQQRDLDQIRADIFTDLLTGDLQRNEGPPSPSRRTSVIDLHIDLTTLACLNEDPAIVPGFGPVLADIARQTVEQVGRAAQWRFTVSAAGEAIAEGRLRYRPTPVQRAFIVARDVTCRAPGCRRPSRRCDIDHIRDWSKGGLTTVDNLCSLCELHHQAKHAGGFKLRRTGRGVEWITPLGRRYTVLPDKAPPQPRSDLGSDGDRHTSTRFRR